jgi:endonuclease/exonuclease/phosphatase family metal-dependent hydrolase
MGLGYRVAFVYEVRPGRCEVGGGVAVAPAAAPSSLAEPPSLPRESPKPPGAIRVLSYNIEGHAAAVRPDHLEEVARVIRELQPDVVALQEVHRGTWQARFADQAAELGQLTGMAVAFGPSFHVWGGEFGNAILTRGVVHEPRVVRLPSFGEPRSLLSATVALDGGEVDVLVTHLAAWGGLNRHIRTEQARCLAEHAKAARRPLVLCGDLNATPGSPEVATLLAGDLVHLTGALDEPTHPLLGQRIDYIVAGPGWRVGPTAVLHVGPSDHWPVVAELTPVAVNGHLHDARSKS